MPSFAVLARYLHEGLHFGVERASSLTGMFGGWVWFLAVIGGALADRLGFRRALSLAYLLLTFAYFLLGSIGSAWLAPLRDHVPLVGLVAFILILPALGVALVKPCVVGTTARASKENVRSVGYSIYYTLVNVGSTAGPLLASWAQKHGIVENVFRIAALSVFLMFFVVLLLFKEPRRSDEGETESLAQVGKNFLTVALEPALHAVSADFHRILDRLLAGIHRLAALHSCLHQPQEPTPKCCSCGDSLDGHLLHHGDRISHQEHAGVSRHHAGHADLRPGLDSADRASQRGMAVATLVVVAIGEIVQQPRYYEYISRLAPSGQQGTYMGFAFLPLGIGSFIGGRFGGWLHASLRRRHAPAAMVWWSVMAVGVATAGLLWIYDRLVRVETARVK